MALGADETVSSGHLRLLRIDVHFFKVQDCKRLNDGQAAADVADTQMTDAGHNVAADVFADFFQIIAQCCFLLNNSLPR